MNILAAFTFFTRLPFGRLHRLPAESFKHIVAYWPLVGWLTGGTMVGILWLTADVLSLPLSVALLLTLLGRLFLTGGLHEDGLADFFDGLGGGTNRERTLAIMKDSHIGSYGVISLILYFLLAWSMLLSLPLPLLYIVLLGADVWSKFIASQLINLLPYARKAEESKAKVVYEKMTWMEWTIGLVAGSLPFFFWFPLQPWLPMLLPVVLFLGLCLLLKRRIQGYTGDCFGALFLLCELTFYLAILLTMNLWK